ncbi:hypothetical protein BGZ63DRAFT_172996 [Mariannaea sp. PMI_226]|nr:hypothetical protein BGZ63DRAFT_172996 [Mariannaea sp. PMI_226]
MNKDQRNRTIREAIQQMPLPMTDSTVPYGQYPAEIGAGGRISLAQQVESFSKRLNILFQMVSKQASSSQAIDQKVSGLEKITEERFNEINATFKDLGNLVDAIAS